MTNYNIIKKRAVEMLLVSPDVFYRLLYVNGFSYVTITKEKFQPKAIPFPPPIIFSKIGSIQAPSSIIAANVSASCLLT